jgi:hypothetical protein
MESAHYKALAVKQGVDPDSLVRRPLTYDEFNAFQESEKCWHLNENSAAVNKALAEYDKELREVKSKTQETKRKISRFEVEDPAAIGNLLIESGGQFSIKYPQFIAARKYTDRVLRFIQENELLPELDSFVAAFRALANSGEIAINVAATGLSDDDTELTGSALQARPDLNQLLQPVTPDLVERRRVLRMDDKALKAWQREKEGAPDVPPMIKARIEKAFVTFTAMHPDVVFDHANKTKLLQYLNDHPSPNIDYNTIRLAYESLLAAGEMELYTNVVMREGTTAYDYSQIQRNERPVKPVPTPTVRENLERKIRNMSAENYDKWIQTPANRRAADNLR